MCTQNTISNSFLTSDGIYREMRERERERERLRERERTDRDLDMPAKSEKKKKSILGSILWTVPWWFAFAPQT
jgi:hypothetical protein